MGEKRLEVLPPSATEPEPQHTAMAVGSEDRAAHKQSRAQLHASSAIPDFTG